MALKRRGWRQLFVSRSREWDLLFANPGRFFYDNASWEFTVVREAW
jgi:hypothetical protein